MPNIASLLKSEIARVARKEVRAEVETLKKANAQHRSAIAALRRQLDAMQKELRRLGKPGAAAAPSPRQEAGTDEEGPARRFSATRLAAHRAKLGVSAAVYGKLVDIGGQTIYNWEQGKSRPNALQIRQLAEARALNPKALLAQLGAVEPN